MKNVYQIIAEIGGYPVVVATETKPNKALTVLAKHTEIHQAGILEAKIKIYLSVTLNNENS